MEQTSIGRGVFEVFVVSYGACHLVGRKLPDLL
jgi:hypothetical protein